MKPRVFVVNEPLKRNGNGEMVRFLDMSAALHHGELVFLLPPGPLAADPAAWLPTLKRELADFAEKDSILPVGDVTAIGAAVALAALAIDEPVAVLQWRRRAGTYQRVLLDL